MKRPKCFKKENRDYKKRVKQIEFEIDNAHGKNPHRVYVIEEYHTKVFE